MNRSIEEIDKIVDIVLTDKDVQDALNDRILAQNLEDLKRRKAYEDGEEEKSKKIARELLKQDVDISIIKISTGLSDEELKK